MSAPIAGRTLVVDPRLAVSGEPGSAFHMTVPAQVLDRPCHIRRERGRALLVAGRNLDAVSSVGAHFGDETRPADTVPARPAMAYAQASVAVMPRRRDRLPAR